MSIINYTVNEKAGCQVKLLIGNEVYLKLMNEEFLKSWDKLYQSCSWATAFQSLGFVSSWYNIYKKRYTPILITAYDKGELIGLLPLALFGKGKKIVGAGRLDAEYQTWLAIEHRSDEFIKKALVEVTKQYPQSEIELRFVPGNTPLEWLHSDRAWKHRFLLRKRSRPLMLLNAESILRELRKKNKREKINRLKRLGDLSFECVTDRNAFSMLFDTIAEQYDFRQASKYNRTYFKSDPLKKEFLLELFDQNLLHVTLLKLNNEIIAANVAVAGRNWVHLKGMNTWSPFYAKYSPGILQFLMLGQQLSGEGYTVFDLTPGDDPYKELLATSHDEVYELWIYGNTKSYIRNLFRKELYFKILRQMGTTPLMFEVELKKRIQKLKGSLKLSPNKSISGFTSDISKISKSLSKVVGYKIEVKNLAKPLVTLDLKKDNLSDLLNYEPNGGKIRCDFLTEAMVKFETSQHCYTLVRDNELIACVWLKNSGKDPELTAETITMHEIYYHPNHVNLVSQFLVSAVLKVIAEKGHDNIYICTNTKYEELNSILKEIGCTIA